MWLGHEAVMRTKYARAVKIGAQKPVSFVSYFVNHFGGSLEL
jgi:hypothetical protein